MLRCGACAGAYYLLQFEELTFSLPSASVSADPVSVEVALRKPVCAQCAAGQTSARNNLASDACECATGNTNTPEGVCSSCKEGYARPPPLTTGLCSVCAEGYYEKPKAFDD